MKTVVAAVAVLAGFAVSHPTLQARDSPCPTFLYSIPQCCTTNLLDVAALSCKNPASAMSAGDFKGSCGTAEALCCSVPAASLAVLCNPVI